MVNISYTEILEGLIVEDVENIYTDKTGTVYKNNDLYYKQISLSGSSDSKNSNCATTRLAEA